MGIEYVVFRIPNDPHEVTIIVSQTNLEGKEMSESSEKTEIEHARRGPLSALPRLEQELERFFGSRWPKAYEWPSAMPALESRLPNVDVIDREDEVCVKAEVPGFKKKEIDVSVNHNSLTIKAQTSSETIEEDGDYHRREMSRGYLARTVALPSEVEGEKAKAQFDNGVLEVIVPKVPESKRQRVKID